MTGTPDAPVYAIGDVHGQRAMLEDALALIEADGGPGARIVFLGDYVDRGPDSRGVLELLVAGRAEGRDWICLKGNHDQMAARFLESEPRSPMRMRVGFHWLHERIGGRATLASYAVRVGEDDVMGDVHARARAAVPAHHVAFLEALPLCHRQNGLFFVHAGIEPGVPLDEQNPDEMMWIRKPFTGDARAHPALIVHGHTAIPAARHHGNRVNLDSGAGHGGPLTAAVFEGTRCWELTRAGRRELRPTP